MIKLKFVVIDVFGCGLEVRNKKEAKSVMVEQSKRAIGKPSSLTTTEYSLSRTIAEYLRVSDKLFRRY